MIRVIIEREIVEGLESFYESAIANLLNVMAKAPGYVSGESSVEIHRPNRYVVITRWIDEAAWNNWLRFDPVVMIEDEQCQEGLRELHGLYRQFSCG